LGQYISATSSKNVWASALPEVYAYGAAEVLIFLGIPIAYQKENHLERDMLYGPLD
jgi:hypothetical protein